MHTYSIIMELDGKKQTVEIEASNPGMAFGKALSIHPTAKLLSGFREGKIPGGGFGAINYDPPSTVHIEKSEPENQEQMEMKI